MYSHQNPPNRRMYINGHLSLPFPLGAGVAQGCPLSPLLFLLITEPLSRMFKRNTDLQGVTIDNIRHVISQYADDTTLILKPGDEATVRELLRVWKKGTAMMENVAKREGLLLGALRAHPVRAADNVVGAWTPDGSTIRALGVPIGNGFNEYEWWHGKYREVKARIARWPSLRRLSITGRNILLQAIYYGMFRFWLYSMVLSPRILKMMGKDAKQIIWAHIPHLEANEEGSSTGCRR
jgi:hypothetical protein